MKHCQEGVAGWNSWDDNDKAEGLFIALTKHVAGYVYNQPEISTASFE